MFASWHPTELRATQPGTVNARGEMGAFQGPLVWPFYWPFFTFGEGAMLRVPKDECQPFQWPVLETYFDDRCGIPSRL